METSKDRQRPRRRGTLAAFAGTAALVLTVSGSVAAYATGGSGTVSSPTAGGGQAQAAQDNSARDALGWSKEGKGSAAGLGPRAGILPAGKQVLESALQVDLTHETVRLPLYPGTSHGQRVWYVLLDASDQGAANDLGVNYAPKLANVGIGNPAAVQTVKLQNPKPADNPFGPAVLDFPGAPDFSPKRVATPGPNGFPLAAFTPGAVAKNAYSPFIRIDGSPTVYDAPIVAVGDGPFDVDHHSNTGDRVLKVHIAPPSPPGKFLESWADLLFVKGFDAGQPIVYLSTDAGQPLTAVLERSTYVPALDTASYNGGDDFLGSARERLFAFVNGQTGRGNKQAQGFRHLVLDGHASEDASAKNTKLINALRDGGDLLNVFGDFPTLRDPRHSQAYSPLWDAQLGEWTPKAVKLGYDKRQIDENVVFNLAATRPDLLTGPGGAPYGSVGIDIDCAVIAYLKKPPTKNLQPPAPHSQFPPR